MSLSAPALSAPIRFAPALPAPIRFAPATTNARRIR